MLLNFDYDGVIVDSLTELVSLCSRAQAKLGLGRLPTPEDFATMENLTLEEVGRMIGIPETSVAEYGQLLFRMQNEEGWDVPLFPGISSVLDELSRKHTLVVITSSHSGTIRGSLAQHGLAPLFADVLGGELGQRKSERIADMMNRFGSEADATFMIGDAVSDIREGKDAGVMTIATTWGYQAPGFLLEEKPDYVAVRPEDLIRILA